ncbi:mechanosensitive ion channel family protein [Allorhodopirellula solitaria]|uniref:Small-conductance mechanosensitive channel n=1 Tax=Allorhodopirellula solitaria TaxID=2527987 RepID=A0A5C5XTV2_9BACT|nr:mechanosensitive ion channel family protein [Allorhodopirellula solitaria]TWT66019.1 Small-conductance mechanosensitive channel [Allorhodopirellula solitaria]
MKNGSSRNLCLWLLVVWLGGGLSASMALAAEGDAATESTYTAHTTINPAIPLDQLKVMVKPLTRSELQVESDAWFKLLRSKAREIAAVRMGVKKANEALNAKDDQAAKSSLKVAESITKTATDQAKTEEKEVTAAAQENMGVEEVDGDSPSDEGAEAEADETASDAVSAESDTAGDDTAGDDTTGDDTTGDDTAGTAETDPQEAAEAAARTETVNTASKLKGDMLTSVTELQDQRTVLNDRLRIVLDSLEAKGGDVSEYRTYSAAVSGIELDTSDAASAWAGIVGWLTSKEGGQRLAWNVGRFALILLVTYFVAKIIAAIVNWLLDRKLKLSQLAERLIASMIKNVVMLVGFAIALTALEVDITPVLAAIGATGLVVGLALQGTLSNFASGLMILINRPFDVGNVVSAGGITGTIAQMNLVSTTFRTFDNQTIHVPNNEIWNNVITNITANPTRRVDLEFGIGYDDDFEQAEDLIKQVLDANALVLSDPQPVVVTHELADSSVNIVCRPWAKTTDWWQVKTEVTREVKRKFDQAGISIPYPQQDVHFYGSAVTPGGNA